MSKHSLLIKDGTQELFRADLETNKVNDVDTVYIVSDKALHIYKNKYENVIMPNDDEVMASADSVLNLERSRLSQNGVNFYSDALAAALQVESNAFNVYFDVQGSHEIRQKDRKFDLLVLIEH